MLHLQSQNCPFQGFSGACMGSWVQDGSARSRDTPPVGPRTPLLYHPISPAFPLNPPPHCQSQNCPIKFFWELAWAHTGPRWLRSLERASGHLLSTPSSIGDRHVSEASEEWFGGGLKRSKRARKGFDGGTEGEVMGIILGVPQHASLFSPVANVPSPTSSVPISSMS